MRELTATALREADIPSQTALFAHCLSMFSLINCIGTWPGPSIMVCTSCFQGQHGKYILLDLVAE
ncbi:hypothetical protein Q6240_30145, partial [Klebsiella pneumoniae]